MANLPDRVSAAAVNGVSPRHHLALDLVPNLRVVNGDAAWAVFTPGQPFAVEPPVTVLAPPLPNLLGKDGDAGLSTPAWFVPPVNSNDPGGAATGAR
ncbi:hypothetical protein ADIAG_01509 [Paeniglutamicibacter gangotriensis Lz1y]|uniref:Uncharacterized protein n=1 Tax=Paeniglutamicibacter gangotriensis Lz1y TaxID=1276920 RepID=M7NLV0_9MICC|nr:hypothetical protein ADIAG_01509 [Paeniglutamicibacter gangotriensis Lz1y]